MKKILLLSLFAFSGIAIFGDPVKSMLAASGTEMLSADSIPLPDGVTAVEYLESTGEQYIDTGYVVHDTTASRWDIQVVKYNDGSMGLMKILYVQDGAYYLNFYNGKLYPRYGKTYLSPITSPIWEKYGRNIVVFDSGCIVVNGTTVYSGQDVSILSSNVRSLYVFGMHVPDTYKWFIGRVFRLTLFEGDDCTLDLIPVRVDDEDGNPVGALYDLISGELYFNQGTGSFILGPDL